MSGKFTSNHPALDTSLLGEKIVRVVNLLPNVVIEKGASVKDELVLTG